jgi:hypothetical protein
LKKENEIHASFAAIPQSVKVTATVHDKCLAKMETVFVVWYFCGFRHTIGVLEHMPYQFGEGGGYGKCF